MTTDPRLTLPDGRTVALKIKVHAAAKRLKLKIPHSGGFVKMTLPKGMNQAQALAFAEEKADWIAAHLPAGTGNTVIEDGCTIPYQGRSITLKNQPDAPRAGRLDGDTLYLGGEAAGLEARLINWLKKQAREELSAKAAHYAAKLGVAVKGVSLKDTKTRWGSCSSAGRLNFSWRLIMAPPFVLDYVVAHEVSHLEHLDHSTAFWTTLHTLHGPYAPAEQWLKLEGAGLHRVLTR